MSILNIKIHIILTVYLKPDVINISAIS